MDDVNDFDPILRATIENQIVAMHLAPELPAFVPDDKGIGSWPQPDLAEAPEELLHETSGGSPYP
ncbi:hypothetical protein ACSBOB_07040 [Mesorhizobium sp. ASY16-5R]|uniref:hypothetical protein n=1 Tax=Mesorhizobium sp. ASY16-5R TaxID=3445772 RepID=UPI003F9FA652